MGGFKVPPDLRTLHLRITGKVQGVGYRRYTQLKAEQLGLRGWVRNRLDGSVEALVQGAPEAVEALVKWAHGGSPKAVVTDVRVTHSDGQELADGFQTLPTE